MITSKQRAYLRKLANGIEPIFQIGKGGVSDELLKQLAIALEARELIKVHILETALLDTKAATNEIAAALGAEPVQAIGSKFVLYKQAKNVKNRKIELPRK
jgi:RNA-binding protein